MSDSQTPALVRPRPSLLRRAVISLFDRPLVARSLPALLFGLTVLSVWWTGGVRLAVAMLGILLAHEMGHYFACRAHGVECTPPLFIPAPLLNPLVGTLGALILIRGPFPSRRALFDIGIAGPLGGLVVCIPVLVLGLLEAQVVPATHDPWALYLGEPLLFQWGASLLHGPIPDGMTLQIGPFGMAAWFGLFVTGLNLIPIGQLDGGHILYAVLRRRAYPLARAAWWLSLGLVIISPSWILWAILTRFLGRPHPPTLDDRAALGKARTILAGVALLAFIVCFLPEPIDSSWSLFLEGPTE